jgi:hypothetical protein
MLLTDLSRFLRASEGTKVAVELEQIVTRLEPFKCQKLKAFGDFLLKVEEHMRKPPAATRGGGGSRRKPDPKAVAEACDRLLHFYNQAVDPSVTLEQIEGAVQTLDELNPAKGDLEKLATRMGSSQRFKTKADVVKFIKQRIVSRKGAFDRVNA